MVSARTNADFIIIFRGAACFVVPTEIIQHTFCAGILDKKEAD